MAKVFDAYHAWLGIAPKDQPPNHYRLLGVDLFEDEPETIEHAADRQMAHLRTFQTGRHSALSQRLLNEVAAARLCLTAFQCVDQIDATFEVDRLGMKTAILAGWAKDARTLDARKWLVEQLFAVGDEALDAGNVDSARELGKLVTSKSAGLRDKELVQRLKTFRQRFNEAGKDAEELQQAQAFLAKEASHAPSNLVVGRYLCFTKGDWKRGLPLLALASDETLKRLAAEELAASNPQSPIPNP